jgi:hypothetical protein
MFGSSIVFSGKELDELYEDTEGNTYNLQDIDKLFATDLVDSPAATDGLFSMNADDLAFKMTEFLDTNPRIFELVSKKPEIIDEFMNKYNAYRNKQNDNDMDKTFFEEIKSMFAEIKNKLTSEPVEIENKIDLAAIENKIAEVELMNTELSEKVEALETLKAAYDSKELENAAEITRLQAIETEYAKLLAKGTKIEGPAGMEDGGENVSEQVKQLMEDVNKIKNALNPPEVKPAPIKENE